MPLKDPDARRAHHRKYMKETWYPAHKSKHYSIVKNRLRELKAWLDGYKAKPCMDCGGVFHPCAMDFDHRDPKAKILTLANAVRSGWSIERLKLEIDKCDLVCSNCHRVRTYKRATNQVTTVNASDISI